MEGTMEATTSSAPSKSVIKPTPLKNASLNPYVPRFSTIEMYTNLAATGSSGKVRQESAPKHESSRFVNPYVSARPTKPRPNVPTRTLSETAAHSSTPAAMSSSSPQPSSAFSSSPFTRPSGTSARPLASSNTQRRADPDWHPEARTSSASSLRHRQRSRGNGGASAGPSTKPLPANPNPPPGPDSTWIPKNLALKMRFSDFEPGEYLTRDDWPTPMKFPDNLDPPQGLATLRCLFCEKQYAGVNARSMWRRHVSQKHDVILAGSKSMGIVMPRSRSRKSAKARSAARRSAQDEAVQVHDVPDDSDEDGDADHEDVGDDSMQVDGSQGSDSESEVEEEMEPAPSTDPPQVAEPIETLTPARPGPVLVADHEWEDVSPSILFPYATQDLAPTPARRMLATSTPNPMRRTVSTPAYLPSPATASASFSAFLLPAFGEGDTPIRSAKKPADFTTSSTDRPRSPVPTIPGPQFNHGTTARQEITVAALKKHKAALLPGITLAPALRSPRADAFSSPPAPRISRRTRTGLTPRWARDMEAATSGYNDDSPMKAGPSRLPSTPDKSRPMRRSVSRPEDLEALGANAVTPAPPGRKRTMSESERFRWIMALESPGPLGTSGGGKGVMSPDGPAPSSLIRSKSFLVGVGAGSPMQQAGASGSGSSSSYRARTSFLMPPPITSSPLAPPIGSGEDVKENDSDVLNSSMDSSTSAILMRTGSAHRRMRSHSMFDTPGSSSIFSLSSRRSPRFTGGTHTRSSSVDLMDTSFSSIDDDPFRSLRLESSSGQHHSSSFPFDLETGAEDGHPGRILFGNSPFKLSDARSSLKRGRDDEHEHDDTGVTIMSPNSRGGAPSEGGLSPALEIDSYDWDKDMSPIKKRVRYSS